ncbi:hypothetical protein Tco_1138007 [Tanacetum coccineum]
MKFTVIATPSPYNIIPSRPGIKALRAIPSTIYVMMKFATPRGVATLVIGTTTIYECQRSEKRRMVEEPKQEKKRKEISLTEEMAEDDEEKTNFYTDQGTFSYTKMSFGLKNVNATYQRLVDLEFEYQIGRNLKAYVDDMVVKSIRANAPKTKDIAEMQSPQTWGQMQSLSGKLAALNRFLALSVDKSLPFFETLKNITKENKAEYRWTGEAENTFQEC